MSSAKSGEPDDDFGRIPPLAPGDPQRIGPYLLLGRLGAGGMGRVFLARSGGGRTVAVKVVHEEHTSNAHFRARFRREIDAARRVGERYTAPVLDADPDADRPWVATGYVPGPSLEQVVRRYGPLPADSVHALADGLLRALRDIHAAGIVHRDLKPSNVMLTVEGPRVIDFGIARALQTSVDSLLTSTGMVIGSPGFMSPEQVRGQEAGTASDVFTLGCVLMYAATGLLPFGQGAGNQHAVMYQIVEDEPDLSEVRDEALRTLIARCLTKDVAGRAGVDELLADAPRQATANGVWLPAELVAHLARQAARLLDVEASPVRETDAAPAADASASPAPGTPDRATVGLRGKSPDPALAPAPSSDPDPSRAPAGGESGKAAPGGGEAGEPGDQGGQGEPGRSPAKASERERRSRRPVIIVAAVAVVGVGGGAVTLLQPGSVPQAGRPGNVRTASPTPGNSSGLPRSSPPQGASSPQGSDDKGKDEATDGGGAGGGGGGKEKEGQGKGGTAGGSAGSAGQAPASGGSNPGGSGGSGSSGGSNTASSGGGAGGSGTSGGGASGGGTADGGKVPSSFVGTWSLTGQYAIQPGTLIISRAATGGHAVRLISDITGTGHCESVAKLVSVAGGGNRINIGPAVVDQARSTGICGTSDPSYLILDDPSGIRHNVGPAHGDGYHYERAN